MFGDVRFVLETVPAAASTRRAGPSPEAERSLRTERSLRAERSYEAVVRAVCAVTGAAASGVSIVSVCRHCGGPHGALVVTPGMPDAGSVWASLSRAGGYVIAAATTLGPIGVDIESVNRMSRSPLDRVAFHPRELAQLSSLPPASRDRTRTVVWTRKEALLKATGHGLRVAPASVWLSGMAGGDVGVLDATSEIRSQLGVWPGGAQFLDLHGTDLHRADLHGAGTERSPLSELSPLSLPDGLVGSVCVLA